MLHPQGASPSVWTAYSDFFPKSTEWKENVTLEWRELSSTTSSTWSWSTSTVISMNP